MFNLRNVATGSESIWLAGTATNSFGFQPKVFVSQNQGANWDELPDTGGSTAFRIWVDRENQLYGVNNTALLRYDSLNTIWDMIPFNPQASPQLWGDIQLYFDQNNQAYALLNPANGNLSQAGVCLMDFQSMNHTYLGMPSFGNNDLRIVGLNFSSERFLMAFSAEAGVVPDTVS